MYDAPSLSVYVLLSPSIHTFLSRARARVPGEGEGKGVCYQEGPVPLSLFP